MRSIRTIQPSVFQAPDIVHPVSEEVDVVPRDMHGDEDDID